MERKYEIIYELPGLRNTHRIRALKDFGDVKAGDIGGYVSDYYNLSQKGDCWVYDNGMVYGHGRVTDHACVYHNAKVYDNGYVIDNAIVKHSARVRGDAFVKDCAYVSGHATITGFAKIMDDARVFGESWVGGEAKIFNDAIISGNPAIFNAAHISTENDYFILKGFGSTHRTTTFYIDKDRNVFVNCGCFDGSLEAFERAVRRTHKHNSKYRDEYLALIKAAKIHFRVTKMKTKYLKAPFDFFKKS